MQPYQIKYVENVREIRELIDWFRDAPADFEGWYAGRRQAEERTAALRRENDRLLSEHLFPALDDLHNASAADIRELEEFGDQLMDWTVNLDTGVYVVIHDALLSLYRLRRDRPGIIRELYKLGMGMYYQNRILHAFTDESARVFRFENEMVFTEGGSYIRYFADLGDEETQGYVLRSLANISICCGDLHRRVAISARILQIVQDEYYRSLAPGLPWDVYLRRTHQQMSSNRNELSGSSMTKGELAAVLESCHEVFKPEEGLANPNLRWVWPYYEMEYNCGFADLNTTLARLEKLIRQSPDGLYDVSGLYGNVQLPLYYARLMKNNPALRQQQKRLDFLNEAYGKMMRCLMTYPLEQRNDFFTHILGLVIGDYYEIEGVPAYRDIAEKLMRRFSGVLYIRSRRAADMMRCLCEAILDGDPRFFDDIPELGGISDPAQKKKTALDFAFQCGLFHDLGLVAMNTERLQQTRSLFEAEYQRLRLRAIFTRDELKKRPSTAPFSDVAGGLHRWYNGAEGYPASYVRTRSPYRQMTDTAAVAVYLLDHSQDGFDAAVQQAQSLAHKRFSPVVTAYLQDEALVARLRELATGEGKEYYREVFEQN